MVRVVVFAVGFGFPGSDVGAVGERGLGEALHFRWRVGGGGLSRRSAISRAG